MRAWFMRRYRSQNFKNEIDLFVDSCVIAMGTLGPNEYTLLTSPENSSAVCKYSEKFKKLEVSAASNSAAEYEQRCAMQRDHQLVTLIGPRAQKRFLGMPALRKVFDDLPHPDLPGRSVGSARISAALP